MDDNSFGSIDEVLVAQEARLHEVEQDKRKLLQETLVLGAALEAVQKENRALQRRATDAEARAEAQEASSQRAAAAAAAAEQRLREEAERRKHRGANDRILLEQAERGRHDAEAQLGAAQRHAAAVTAQNGDLRQQLTACQRQVRKLESLAPFADAQQEQRAGEAAMAVEVERANTRVHQLEGRCASLESELQQTAAALTAAQQLMPPAGGRMQPQHPHPHQHQQHDPSASLSLADLCDLEGANTQFVGCSSPQSTHSDAAWRGGDGDGGLPSVRHALQQRRVRQQQQQQLQAAKQREAVAEDEAASDRAQQQQQVSLVEGLQQQLLEQQRQLAHLQLQQHVAMGSAGGGANGMGVGSPEQAAAAVEQARRQGELEKLQRRNMQLQTALAETSLQHARASAALQKQLQEAQQEGQQLRQQRDDAQQQLALLQAAAAAMDGEDAGGGGGGDAGMSSSSCEQLGIDRLLEYAERCNSAVEQNAALLQEKKSWLEKVAAAEAEVERCRAEVHQLHLQRLHLAPCGTGSADSQQQQEEEVFQRLLEAQAGEAALRSVLHEARVEQVAACKALSSELRRVHALERLRISDMAEVQRLQRRLHEVQHECRQLFKALAAAQQQGAGSGGRGGQLGTSWAAAAAGQQQQQAGVHADFRMSAMQ